MSVLRTVTAYPREAFGVTFVALAAFFGVLGLTLTPSPPLSGPAEASVPPTPVALLGKPPEPEPLRFKDVAPEDARTINAVLPFSNTPNPAARPFAARFADVRNEARALDCLTAAVYYEAAIEGPDGQRAVAQVVLNRLRHPAYPDTVCGVVFQGSERSTGCQFTFTCDGALARRPVPALWDRARAIAWGALSGQVYAPVGWATHYHTDWVVPYWASSLAKAAKVGTHIFYRWTGGWGRPAAFGGHYTGVEPGLIKMAGLSAAHGDAVVDVAAASDAALDELAANDEIVVEKVSPERITMRLNTAAAAVPGTFVDTETRRIVAAKPMVAPAKADAKVPWELRWALTGVGAGKPEPALGPAATSDATKPCTRETSVPVPGGKSDAAIKVREKCGA